jgi:hypothetical protein
MITRGLALPVAAAETSRVDPLDPVVGWRHPADRRGDLNGWSDRSL